VIRNKDFAAPVQQAKGLVNCNALGMYRYPLSALPADLNKHQHWDFYAVYASHYASIENGIAPCKI
jgi:hypothetical protein